MDNNENKSKFFDANPVEAAPVVPTPPPEPVEQAPRTPVQQEHPVFDLMASNDAVEHELEKKKEEEQTIEKKNKLGVFIGIILIIALIAFIIAFSIIFPNTGVIRSANIIDVSCVNDSCILSVEIETDDEPKKETYIIDKSLPILNNIYDYRSLVVLDLEYKKTIFAGTITDYKMYVRSTSEDITSVKTEEELREKLGLLNEGNYTKTLKLTKIGSKGTGYNEELKNYNYIVLTFKNNTNEYEMMYIPELVGDIELVEGKEYIVTFTIKKELIKYEITINAMK